MNRKQNLGRLINFISGITGIAAGGVSVINMPVNLRAHRLKFDCSGIAYQTPTVALAAGDAGTGTITATVTNGVITGLVLGATNSTKGAGTYPLTITDSNYTAANGLTYKVGQGATGTYTVNGANVITAVALTSGGVASPVPPELFFTSFKQQVNGINLRDIQPAEIMRIYASNPTSEGQRAGIAAGEFPIFYTEPWRNENHHNELTSWDLAGQSTWQIQAGIANIGQPSLTGAIEFDFKRNVVPGAKDAKGNAIPLLQPVAQHQFSVNVPSGRYDITTLPASFPIARLWLYATNSSTGARLGAGSITQLEVYQDKNKVLEVTQAQMLALYNEYGFDTNIYDAMFIADPDGRIFKALQASELIVRVYSAQACTVNVVMETLPGAYA